MSIWEMLRRFGRIASLAELASACELSAATVREALERLVAVGLAEGASVRRGGRGKGFRAIGERIVIEIDPKQPADLEFARVMASEFERESREQIERSLASSRQGFDGYGRSHAYAYLTLSPDEAKELRGLFKAVDTFVARVENRPIDPKGPAPEACNYHLAIHVAPMQKRMLPRARITLVSRNLGDETRTKAAAEPTRHLSNREREVAGMLAAGLTKAEVAKRMRLATSTVSTLTVRIYRKLGVRRRQQLIAKLKGA